MSERRAHARHTCELPVQFERTGSAGTGVAQDVGAGGMRLRVEGGGELKVGETIYVRFELPELDGPVEVSGKVRWVDRIDPQMGGMQFADGLRAKQVWAINRLGG